MPYKKLNSYMKIAPHMKAILEEYCGTLLPDEVAVSRFSIKIDSREYQVRDTEGGPEMQTEIGWLTPDRFIGYLLKNEKTNSILDLASIGLDRLINKKK